jgi:exodeoxyribonuclease V beta subunit
MKRLDAATVPLSGIHLVEASAGTGKTHAITTLYCRAVTELGLLPDKILVVTFTRAATAELRERIRLRLREARQSLVSALAGEPTGAFEGLDAGLQQVSSRSDAERALARLESALLVIDEAAVMTIHGFCAKVLDGHAFESRMGLSLDLLESTSELVDEIVTDFIATHLSVLSPARLSLLQPRGLDSEAFRQLAALVLSRPRASILPAPTRSTVELDSALEQLSSCRRRALEWLSEATHESDLACLQKTKRGAGLGVRLLGYIEKSRRWLTEPVGELAGRCESFDKLRDLREKNPSQVTPGLARFFELLAACDEAYDQVEAGLEHVALELRRRFALELVGELEGRKQRQRVQTYEDLLERLRSALDGAEGEVLAGALRDKYPLALIDEFQDTDPIQYEVFSRVYGRRACLFMIGDPKQSIYAFRGADVENYLRAAKTVGEQRHTLEVNYRSDPAVIQGLERLLGEHPDPFCGSGIEFVRVHARPDATDANTQGDGKSGVLLLYFDDEPGVGSDARRAPDAKGNVELPKYRARALALEATVGHVAKLLSSDAVVQGRRIRPSDVAVLTRTNRECNLVCRALRHAGLRCIETTDGSVLESDAQISIVRLLRALLRQNDVRAVSSLLLDELVGIEPHALPTVNEDESALEDFGERLARWFRVWARSGALAMLLVVLEELDVPARILANPGGERWLTDWTHVAELVQSAATRLRLSPAAQLDWLVAARGSDEHCSLEDRQLRIESDDQAVLVTTIHRSKGLQFPFVICPFLWDGGAEPRRPKAILYRARAAADGAAAGVLPKGAKADRSGTSPCREPSIDVLHLKPAMLDPAGPEWSRMRAERLAEAARLVYVALTRAKHQAVVPFGPAKGFGETALGRLLGPTRHAPTLAGTDESAGALRPTAGSLPTFDEIQSALSSGPLEVRRFMPFAPGTERELPLAVSPPPPTALLQEPAPLQRVIASSVQVTSYSALTAAKGRGTFGDSRPSAANDVGGEPGRDRDLVAVLGPTAPTVLGEPASLEPGEEPEELVTLGALPNGPRTGEALHSIFEAMDFPKFEEDVAEPDVLGILGQHGITVEGDGRALKRALRAILDVSLSKTDPNLKLRRVTAEQRRAELEFMLKIDGLDVERLARALDPEMTAMPESYAEQLRELGFEPVSGYLRGFIDLVFELDGRYYVADYKSNRLGTAPNDYRGDSLREAMMSHHYPVQAALYAAAVDRYLCATLPNYDYEQHFGGVFYLFLRGMHPRYGAESGVFFHRPSEATLRRFVRALSQGDV